MKSDAELGKRVHEHLKSIGMETPMARSAVSDFAALNGKEWKLEQIEGAMQHIMQVLGLDLTDDSLMDTPKRFAKMYVNELFKGLDYHNFPKCTVVDNKMDAGMVVEKNVKVMSNCEHHFVTIDGVATIAYIPGKKVLGLSKINRIVDFFSRRPQIQERLTNQIWHTLSYILESEDVAVYIDAVHFCVRSRGVEDANSSTVTSKLGGVFMHSADTRAEFMAIARASK
jgi:GTP cyclohydrolase I